MAKVDSSTRDKSLHSALKIFADCGYAASSVEAIVDAARVTKPTLYYYFQSKAGLFQALIDLAHDERIFQPGARLGLVGNDEHTHHGASGSAATAAWTTRCRTDRPAISGRHRHTAQAWHAENMNLKIRRVIIATMAAATALCPGCRKGPAAAGAPAAFAVQAVVVAAVEQPVAESLALVGSLVANEMVELKSETEGTIQQILFQEGQRVKAGEPLLLLDETKFAAAAAEAEAAFKVSESNLERAKRLYGEKLISKQEIDQNDAVFQAARAAFDLKKRQLKDARITAPFSGVVSGRRISPGQVIDKNTLLTVLVDLDPVKVELNVPERFVGQLKIGQKIMVKLVAYPGRTFEGEVYFIAPYVDEVQRTALLKAKIPNPNNELKPGMFANLDLTLQIKDRAIVVPESAVISSGDRTMVYIVDNENTAQVRPVRLGMRQAGMVEILSGLAPGERVVAEGIQKVRPGGKVKPAETSASPGGTNEAPSRSSGAFLPPENSAQRS
jgi:membrane fusion protein (multidrug efflux system)